MTTACQLPVSFHPGLSSPVAHGLCEPLASPPDSVQQAVCACLSEEAKGASLKFGQRHQCHFIALAANDDYAGPRSQPRVSDTVRRQLFVLRRSVRRRAACCWLVSWPSLGPRHARTRPSSAPTAGRPLQPGTLSHRFVCSLSLSRRPALVSAQGVHVFISNMHSKSKKRPTEWREKDLNWGQLGLSVSQKA